MHALQNILKTCPDLFRDDSPKFYTDDFFRDCYATCERRWEKIGEQKIELDMCVRLNNMEAVQLLFDEILKEIFFPNEGSEPSPSGSSDLLKQFQPLKRFMDQQIHLQLQLIGTNVRQWFSFSFFLFWF